MLVALGSLAWAAEIDLARANRALAEGRPDDALAHARKALSDDEESMEAWLTWLHACEVSGLGDPCRAAASVAGEEKRVAAVAAVWHDLKLERIERGALDETLPELAELDRGLWTGQKVPRAETARMDALVRADPDAAAGESGKVLAADPAHPEVLVPLFAEGLPARTSLGKAKGRLVGTGAKSIKKAPVEVVYRWHELFVATASNDEAARSAALLAEKGEPAVLPRHPWTRAQTVQAARELMATPGPFPDIVPSEREAVALRLAEMLDGAGRHAESAKHLAEARTHLDSPSLAIAHGEALLAAGDLEAARRVANEALLLSSLPWGTDVATMDRLGRRTGLAKSLALRGRVEQAAGNLGPAAVDLMVANQLAIQPVSTGDLEKAMAKGRYELETIKMRLETPSEGASAVALKAARAALEAGDFATVASNTTDAIAVLCLPTHAKARLTAKMAFTPELASAFALRGLAARDRGDDDAALVDLTTAVMLLPFDAPDDWWDVKAALHEKLGHADAAFFARAMQQGVDAEGQAKTPLWRGSEAMGSGAAAAMVASWMRGHQEVEPQKDRMKIQRGRVIPFRPPVAGGPGSMRPVINEPFPAWTITDAEGTIDHQPGRIEIVTFFRTDSPNSLRLLDEVTDLARRLRVEKGVNVALFGICMDSDASSLEGMRARREQWGTTKWDPELGKRFGVTAFPTAWVVDSEGIARFKHVGYLGWSDYEAEIRFIVGI
ncbi:MAG: hypothetical protein H6737_25515 [Alphaproteobacteria bacterium]|nr:hypothetical protein [Alphaproteobacteria bacterium]